MSKIARLLLSLSFCFGMVSIPAYSTCDFYIALEEGYFWLNTPGFAFGTLTDFDINDEPISIGTIPQFNAKDTYKSNYTKITEGINFYPSWACGRFCLEGYVFISSKKTYTRRSSGFAVTPNFETFTIPFIDASDVLLLDAGVETTVTTVFSRHYNYNGGGVKLKKDIFLSFLPTCAITPLVAFDVFNLNQEYQTHLQLDTFGSPLTQLNEKLETTYYDIGIGLELDCILCNRFFVGGYAGIYASKAHSDLFANQTFAVPVSVPTSITVRDEKNIWSSKVKANVELGYIFNHFMLSIVGNVENWNYIPRINNPTLAPFSPVSIKNAHAFLGMVGVKVTVPF